ncbi:MAG: hypothetical protein ACI9F9_003339, partial [Candidatus Paceibacteria bacterium]
APPVVPGGALFMIALTALYFFTSPLNLVPSRAAIRAFASTSELAVIVAVFVAKSTSTLSTPSTFSSADCT